MRHVWVLAAGARNGRRVGSALLVRDDNGRRLEMRTRPAPVGSADHAAMSAAVEGLRLAREHGADEVTVLCHSSDVADRLAGRAAIQSGDPMAREVVVGRALSRGFRKCEFSAMVGSRSRGLLRMAADATGSLVTDARLAA